MTFRLDSLLLGSLSASIVAFCVVMVARTIGIDIASYTFWFVIPVGALVVGMCGAGGVALAVVGGKRRLEGGDSLLAFVFSGLTMVLTYAFGYWLPLGDGYDISPSDLLTFWDYVTLRITSAEYVVSIKARMSRSSANIGALGSWSYVHAAIQVIGYVLGAVAAMGIALEKGAKDDDHEWTQWYRLSEDDQRTVYGRIFRGELPRGFDVVSHVYYVGSEQPYLTAKAA